MSTEWAMAQGAGELSVVLAEYLPALDRVW